MRKSWTLALFSILVAATAAAEVNISTEDPYPIRGEATHVIVEDETGPVEGVMVQVEYRPNSSTARTETLDPTDESGMSAWTPRDAGLARMTLSGPDAPAGTTAVSIRYTRFEPSGIAIMAFAGLFLFGGAGYGMLLLLRERKVPAEEPPST